MTLDEVREALRREAGDSVYAWAKSNRISLGYVYDFMSGAKLPGNKILSALGMEKRIEYEYKEPIGE